MKAPRFVQIRFWNVILILSLLLPSMGIEIARPAEVAQAAAIIYLGTSIVSIFSYNQ